MKKLFILFLMTILTLGTVSAGFTIPDAPPGAFYQGVVYNYINLFTPFNVTSDFLYTEGSYNNYTLIFNESAFNASIDARMISGANYTNSSPITIVGNVIGLKSCSNNYVLAYNTSFGGWQCQPKSAGTDTWLLDKAVINASIVANTAAIQSNDNDIAGLQNSLANTNDTVNQNVLDITNLENSLANTNSTVNSNTGDISTNAGDIADNTAQLLIHNASIIDNKVSITQRAFPGDCPVGYVVQNTTTSGVECVLRTEPVIYYNATLYNAIRGTAVGPVAYLNGYNGDSVNVTEQAGAIGLDFRLNFTNVNKFSEIVIRYKNTPGESHILRLQLWDYSDKEWENYGTASEVTDWTIFEFGVFDYEEHIDENGTVQVRMYQEANGNTGHVHYFDWVTIVEGVAAPLSGAEVDPLSIHKTAINDTQLIYTNILSINMSWLNPYVDGRISISPTITGLQSSLVNTNNTVNQNVLDIATNSNSISLLEGSLFNTNVTVNLHTTQITGLQNSLSNTNDTVNSNSAQLLIHNQSIIDNYGWLVSLSSSLANTNSTVNQNTADITSLEGSVVNVNTTANSKASPGVCGPGTVVQNTTTGGVECVLDSDTTYSAGNGISLSGTTFSVAGNTALTQDSDGLSVTNDAIGDTQLTYNTGQHLTTTSNVKHNNFNVTGYTTYEETNGNIEEYSNNCNMKVNSTGIYFIC